MKVYVRRRPDGGSWQLFYTDPISGKRVARSLKAESKKDALKQAGILEERLKSGDRDSKVSWEVFRLRFVDEYLPSRSKRTCETFACAFNQFERHIGKPSSLNLINASTISLFQSRLRKQVGSENTIAQYMRHLKAALRWAAKLGFILRCPSFEMPRLHQSTRTARIVTEVELNRALKNCETLGTDCDSWQFFIRGLWLSGLRMSESMRLHWTHPPVWLDWNTSKRPRIVWKAIGHKARRDEITPITPDFAALLEGRQRTGFVFNPTKNGERVSRDFAGRVVSELCGDFSAHDLRAAFATRWAYRVLPVTLQKLMRHSSITTTLKFYVGQQSDDIAEAIWSTPFCTQNENGHEKSGSKNSKKREKK